MYICEGLFSLNECREAVFSMNLNKTPGTDGLPVEFYRTFWEDVGDIVVQSLNFSFKKVRAPMNKGGLLFL